MADDHDLSDKTVAILVTDGFEQVELDEPLKALKNAGANAHIVAPADTMTKGKVRAWQHTDWGGDYRVDRTLDQVQSEDYDALVLPGGVISPDKLRVNRTALSFVRSFFVNGKPVASICHGPWTLINAGVVEGRRMTSYHSIRQDLINAHAHWVDAEVVVDNGLVTSRNPDDLQAFCGKMIEEIAEGVHADQHA